MPQQQQSNHVMPQVVGGFKRGTGKVKKKKGKKPTFGQVERSVKKTMGY